MRLLRAFLTFVWGQWLFFVAGVSAYIGSLPSWPSSLKSLLPEYPVVSKFAGWIFSNPATWFGLIVVLALFRAYYHEWDREDNRKESRIVVLHLEQRPLVVGGPIEAKLHIRNSGGLVARANVVVNAYTVAIPTDGTSESDLANQWWDTEFVAARDKMDNLIPNLAIHPDQEAPPLWVSGMILTQDDADKYAQGKKRFYFMGRVEYEDARGRYHTDFCRYMDVKISTAPLTSTVHNEEHQRMTTVFSPWQRFSRRAWASGRRAGAA